MRGCSMHYNNYHNHDYDNDNYYDNYYDNYDKHNPVTIYDGFLLLRF